MTLFVDASALVSIIVGEEDGESLAQRVIADPDPIWPALSCWGTISGLAVRTATPSRRRGSKSKRLRGRDRFASSRSATMSDSRRLPRLFGRGRHRANLNFGDCFAYACARTNGAKLLYKGNDFAQTDLA